VVVVVEEGAGTVVTASEDEVTATVVDDVVGAASVTVTLSSKVLFSGILPPFWTQPDKNNKQKTAKPTNPKKEALTSILIMYRLSNIKEPLRKVQTRTYAR
jgi:hypothetical protein